MIFACFKKIIIQKCQYPFTDIGVFILLINASEFLNKNSRVIKIQRKNVFIYFKIKWNI